MLFIAVEQQNSWAESISEKSSADPNPSQPQNLMKCMDLSILTNKSHIFKCTELLNIAFVDWVTFSISRTMEEIGGSSASWGPIYP